MAHATFTKEAENCMRLVQLLRGPGCTALQNVLVQYSTQKYAQPSFDKVLLDSRVKAILKNLVGKGKPLTKGQWLTLYGRHFPQENVHKLGKPETFDITLTFLLVRHLCGLTPPRVPSGSPRGTKPNWDSEPTPSDTSLEANLARIKFYRNHLCHHETGEIPDHEFNAIFDILKQAIEDISITLNLLPPQWSVTSAELDRFRSDPISQDDVRELETMRKDWEIQDRDILDELDSIQKQQKSMDDVQKQRHDEGMEKWTKIEKLLEKQVHQSSEEKRSDQNKSAQQESKPQQVDAMASMENKPNLNEEKVKCCNHDINEEGETEHSAATFRCTTESPTLQPRETKLIKTELDLVGELTEHNGIVVGVCTKEGDRDVFVCPTKITKSKELKDRIMKACPKPHRVVSLHSSTDSVAVVNYRTNGIKLISVSEDNIESLGVAYDAQSGALALTPQGQLVYSDFSNPLSIKVVEDECSVRTVFKNHPGNEVLQNPWRVKVNSKGDIIISDGTKHKVIIMDKDGKVIGEYNDFEEGPVRHFPDGICVIKNDDILVCDRQKKCITHLNSSGKFIEDILAGMDSLCLHYKDPELYVGLRTGEIKVYQLY